MIKIYGAGLAGLLCHEMLANGRMELEIIEGQKTLPNNHKALLRHREDKIAQSTGIEFKRVKVHKAMNYNGEQITTPSIKLSNLYSKKVTGLYKSRSIWNLEPAERFIAPDDFITRISERANITFGSTVTKSDIIKNAEKGIYQISTIPMPVLWNMFADEFGDAPEFLFRKTQTLVCYLKNCDVYQTVYYPNPKLPLYRMSITGNKVIAEFTELPEFDELDERYEVNSKETYLQHFLKLDFGIDSFVDEVEVHETKYGKIIEIDERKRRNFIGQMTRKYNLYSLGRFATWRNILLDDVHGDILKIKTKIKDQTGEW